ncbi:GTPase family protein [Acidithiobacillus caldus]
MPELTIRQVMPIADLIAVHPGFAPLCQIRLAHNPKRLWRRPKGISYDLQVAVLGKTGYGKSSLVNALIGRSLLQTSAVDVCTQTGQCIDFALGPEEMFSLADVPGVGENAEADRRHRAFYRSLVLKSDVLLYVLRADQRDWTVDEELFAKELKGAESKTILVLNQCDKAEPLNRMGLLSDEQQQTIHRKMALVRRSFPAVVDILPVSAALSWNMDILVKTIVRVLLDHPDVYRCATS